MTVRLLVPTSYITVACVSARRYFDLDAVRTAYDGEPPERRQNVALSHSPTKGNTWDGEKMMLSNPAGAPPLDWWEDDRDTVRARLIDMMCPPRVCLTCGEPSRRITTHDGTLDSSRPQAARAMQLAEEGGLTQEHLAAVRAFGIRDAGKAIVTQHGGNSEEVERLAGEAKAVLGGYFREFLTERPKSVGWSDCGHNNWRPGVAYDPFTEDGDPMTVRLLVGDVRDRISEIPDGSVDVVMCSPPFLALRKYGDNAAEMGSERTPADFLDALLELTGEFRRVLTPHGSIAIELGDTYSGSGGAGGDYNADGLREGQMKFSGSAAKRRANGAGDNDRPARSGRTADAWPLAKSLTLIPTLYPASLAYGWNMLNPEHQFDRWRVRNVIVWARPNPPVGALGDKVRPATSYITVACTSAKRFFDLDAVRSEPTGVNYGRQDGWSVSDKVADKFKETAPDNHRRNNATDFRPYSNPAGAPPLDWWEDDDPTGHATLVLPTQPYPGAHYATWPETLASRLIRMMCPLRVCRECGEPSRRMTEVDAGAKKRKVSLATEESERARMNEWQSNRPPGQYQMPRERAGERTNERSVVTLGWSDCGHDKWRPGRVLDPFSGSSTTLAVAQGLGRDATGIELYPANAELSRQRCGMFLEVIE